MWFRKKTKPLPVLPTSRVDYPEGVCVKTEKGHFYIGKKYRHPIKTQRVLDSWRFDVLASTEAAVAHLLVSRSPLGFRAGTVIQNIADSRIFVISKNQKRLVVNPDVLYNYGYTLDDVLVVSEEEANLHGFGEVLK